MQKKRTNVAVIIIAVMALLSAAAFIYICLAKKKLPPTAAKSASAIDITPLLVNKLQQLVMASSDSLYHLSVGQLKSDVLASTAELLQVSLVADSAVLQALDKEQKAPDDVFTLSLDTLRITGISLTGFLHKKDIRLDTIFLSSPNVRVAHTSRPYNAVIRKKDSVMTLYQKLTQQFSSISIAAIVAKDGNVVTTDFSQGKRTTELHNVGIQVRDIKIDSLTQHDTTRFLFSKAADLSCRDYAALTGDSMYVFTLGSLSVSADQHRLIAKDLVFEPRGGKAEFQSRLKTRNDMFTIRFPEIVVSDVDWWALLNRQSLYAGEIVLSNGFIKDYFNRSLPSSGIVGSKNNFPHQQLQQAGLPVLIRKLNIKNLEVAYEEFNPDNKQAGTLTFDNISGAITNITNIPAQIKKNAAITGSAEGLFMKSSPLTAQFRFDLNKLKSGAFSSRFHIGKVPNTLINPVAESMGMYTLKSGTEEETSVAVTGDNHTATTSITMRYHDLRIFPLTTTGKSGTMKKQGLIGFFANTFIIKSANPAGNHPPQHYDVPVVRDKAGGSFFNYLWQCIMTGIVKTIGLPMKFADP